MQPLKSKKRYQNSKYKDSTLQYGFRGHRVSRLSEVFTVDCVAALNPYYYSNESWAVCLGGEGGSIAAGGGC